MNRLTLLATVLTTCGLSAPLFAQDADDVFQRLDANEDGILTAEEVPEAQQRFFDRLVRSGDKNEDGKLSQAEYQATLTEDDAPQDRDPSRRPGEGRFGQGRPGQGRGPGGPGGSDFFARFDKNEDGKLTIDEAPEQMRERLQSIMDRLGTDEIDLEQMNRMRGRDRGDRPSRDDDESAMQRDRPDRYSSRNRDDREDAERREGGRPEFGRPPRGGGFAFMRILDADRNGSISKAEALEVGKLFRELDANDDGELDDRELMGFDGDRPPGMAMGRGDGRPPFGRPEPGDRPEGASDRPERGRPEGDRPERDRPEGDRPEGGPRGRFGDRGPGQGRGPNPMEGFIERFDTDKDGAISKSEAPERMAEGFDRLDTNGDGKLTADEFEAMAGGRRRDGDRPGFGRGRPEERTDRPARPEIEE